MVSCALMTSESTRTESLIQQRHCLCPGQATYFNCMIAMLVLREKGTLGKGMCKIYHYIPTAMETDSKINSWWSKFWDQPKYLCGSSSLSQTMELYPLILVMIQALSVWPEKYVLETLKGFIWVRGFKWWKTCPRHVVLTFGAKFLQCISSLILLSFNFQLLTFIWQIKELCTIKDLSLCRCL